MKIVKSVFCCLFSFMIVCLCACSPKRPENGTGSYYNFSYLTNGRFAFAKDYDNVSESFRENYYDFALKMLYECDKDNGDSTMIAPLSIITALAMTANGARNNTLLQMEALLGGEIDIQSINDELYSFYSYLNDIKSDDATFDYANSVWVTDNSDFSVDMNFIDIINRKYDAYVVECDFTKKETVDKINLWCKDHTDGMIDKIINYDDVGRDTIMALLNAICFEALWEREYEDDFINKNRTFYGTKGEQKAEMMTAKEREYISGDNETGFVKYYKGGKYEFFAILPNDKEISIQDYVHSLDGVKLKELLNKTFDETVNATVPKFSKDYRVSLCDMLQNLGMTDAFNSRIADFSGIGSLKTDENIYISDVIHKTHIDLDSSGTKAAAVTAVILTKEMAIGPDDSKKVVLDRPFVYGIADSKTKLPIFIGTLENI